MKSSSVVALLIVAFITVKPIALKLITAGIFFAILKIISKRKQVLKIEVKDIVEGIIIILINCCLSMDLSIVNFIVLVILNTGLYLKFNNHIFINLLDIYSVSLLVKGVMVFWESV